jgi:hypothetical protein
MWVVQWVGTMADTTVDLRAGKSAEWSAVLTEGLWAVQRAGQSAALTADPKVVLTAVYLVA